MKKKKKIIWIVGGMASGKSTLRNELVAHYKTKDGKLISNDKQEFVDFGKIAVIGNCLLKNQCNGLDSSFSKLKKDGAIANVEYCVKNYDITLLEGSQTSAQWVLPLCEICLNNNAEFILIHLNLRLWENFLRLRTRLIKAGKTEADITNAKLKSVMGKNSQAELICSQCVKTEFVKVICIDTENMSFEDKIFEILNKIG